MPERDSEKLNKLIIAVAKGNTDCLDAIYAEAGGRMYAIAMSLVKDKSAAEDVLQDSFIKIVRFAKGYKKDNPYGWILKIVRNTALDFVRKNNLHTKVGTEDFYALSSLDYSPEKRENAILLEQALSSLEGEEKKVIYFTYYLDMTIREIADELKLSKSATQRILERAEKNLKIFLESGTKG